MADEQYRWLDRDTAERLLRGELLDTVDATARDRAERLAEALETLSAELAVPAPDGAELPGEAAALAAFRKARGADGGTVRHTGRGPHHVRRIRRGGTRPRRHAHAWFPDRGHTRACRTSALDPSGTSGAVGRAGRRRGRRSRDGDDRRAAGAVRRR